MAKLLNVKNNVLKGGKHYLTSDYKTRNSNRSTHNGMDLVGANGIDDIVAIENGTVTYTGYDASGGGYWISITTNGIEHRYFHLKKGSIKVSKGEYVQKGSVIATMGATGNATGANLHFAIYKNGYVDPLPYLVNDNPFNVANDAYKTFVKDIQKAIGANIDGIAGPETLSKTPTISTSTGWNHAAVRPLQVYLQSLGYDLGSYGVDGKFGNDMKACIKKYQNDAGLDTKYQDGIITAKMYTWQKLLKLN